MQKFNKRQILSGVLALTVSGCGQPLPLVFSSGRAVGVDIGISTASTSPLHVTVGFKSLDATEVPVEIADESGTDHRIRGCYATIAKSGGSSTCSSDGSTSSSTHVTGKPDSVGTGHGTQSGPGKPSSGGGALPYALLDASPGNVARQAQTMNDALSVFSSFNGSVKASQSAGAAVNLGTVFATGVAAQQLTEGENYYLQHQVASSIGESKRIAQSTACLAALKTLLGSSPAQASELAICKPSSP